MPALYGAHQEQVTNLPDGANIIASVTDTPVAGFTKGIHIATTQYHPEISPEFFAALREHLAGYLSADMIAAAKTTPVDQAEFAQGITQFLKDAQRQ